MQLQELLGIRFLEFMTKFLSFFGTQDYPVDQDGDEEIDGTIIQNHSKWMKYHI